MRRWWESVVGTGTVTAAGRVFAYADEAAAMTHFHQLRHESPGREAAVFFNASTGEYRVVQGTGLNIVGYGYDR